MLKVRLQTYRFLTSLLTSSLWTQRAMRSKPSHRFVCTSCLERIKAFPYLVGPQADRICGECLRAFFRNAIMAETNWPPTWAGVVLDATSPAYRHAFDARFLRRYDRKAREWDTPIRERVYCRTTDRGRSQCGAFLGRLLDRSQCQQCSKCRAYTCLHCLKSFSTAYVAGKIGYVKHDCDPDLHVLEREQAFAGLICGKDYQDCPNPRCRLRAELTEACNHMICLCGTHYCFRCGRGTLKRSGHWNLGGCPLYVSGVYADEDGGEDPDEAGSGSDAVEAAYIEMQAQMHAEMDGERGDYWRQELRQREHDLDSNYERVLAWDDGQQGLMSSSTWPDQLTPQRLQSMSQEDSHRGHRSWKGRQSSREKGGTSPSPALRGRSRQHHGEDQARSREGYLERERIKRRMFRRRSSLGGQEQRDAVGADRGRRLIKRYGI